MDKKNLSNEVRSQEKKLEINASRQWMSWMSDQDCSFSFSTYQAGKLFFIGTKSDGKLSVFERTFNRVMGLCTDTNDRLYLSSLWQLWQFDNILEKGQVHDKEYDKLYLPTRSWTTGDLDIHDMAVADDGKLYFINCLFGCVATLEEGYSFKPYWKPKWLSRLAPEDRCHLNGLAMVNGKAKYVSAISQTDVNEGWREHRRDGGVIVDIETDEIVCSGLSMPHSPRWYEGKLYVHNSGKGEFGYVDLEKKEFVPICFVPGYLRGLTFTGDYAVAGMSQPRDNKSFNGLELNERLLEKGVTARCGLQVIDLRDGSLPHSLNIDGIINELYDVVTLPGVKSSYVVGTQKDEIRRVVRIAP
ncbi:TIGR03032 family protein [Lentisphaera profundi]|uniref:TIGR03032 family protein n=1 Tax=Lentisphaera profundi TaxID=1658616 RepID=A0ABY7VV64_9BACT|nr:TIGR03032 family protein [Lentisphaera profundi]WDE98118.1 TIGR03032 family protein [Lentisphaera profundi]